MFRKHLIHLKSGINEINQQTLHIIYLCINSNDKKQFQIILGGCALPLHLVFINLICKNDRERVLPTYF